MPTPVLWGFPCGSAGKESACNAGDLGSIPELENPLEKGKASGVENSMNRIAHGHDKMSDSTERLSLPHCQKGYREFKGAKAKNTS